ncbi:MULTISPECIES: peptidoglycan-binding domain-containing protein [unclassified Nostoc]|uniref:peptidoglycan-binding domain-containing protein n=1 Tax=unclassified Nostoc TaxID=2593658 RepID=UPI002AD322B0|nr:MULTISPECIES: peptidoglycan-binding domain-containing protein [unclassified Nostoc]MDZ8096058.1 peptidoglycan-binding domain-containing protein [Nostoc sp. DedQUE05]MDZ8212652.1 peptidoglycan-binding domain-containing protein [Nostoc sp. ChiSLP03a]
MNEIGLMMTGVLTIRQASGTNLPQQQLFQMENDVNQSKQSQLEIAAKVTPPEFMQTDEISQASLSTLKLEKEHILQKISKKNLGLISSNFGKPKKSFQYGGKIRTKATGRFQKFSSQPLPTLYFGSSGIAVRALQQLLVSNGYAVRVDGIFGALTETAVKAFQNQQNLGVDGVVGQRTWSALTI